MTASILQGLRGAILHFTGDPKKQSIEKAIEFYPDGLLVIEGEKIKALGAAKDLLPTYADKISVKTYPNHLILPGFVDTHIHYPQYHAIASYGEQLLSWLDKYIYPEEMRFSDSDYASEVAQKFCDTLIKNGTTSACVFSTVFKESVEALFRAAKAKNLNIISGKTIGDSLGPKGFADTPDSAYTDSKELIEQWHGVGRLQYAITPRFALSCSDEQFKSIQKLAHEFPDVYLQTHISETKDECAQVTKMHPNAKDYLDIYEQYDLVHHKSILAHGIYLSDSELQRIAQANSTVCFCPSSNLFLGSGLFDYQKTASHDINIGVGTDVGAGTSFSLLRTLSDAYKVMQLQDQTLSPWQGFYDITLGGAVALSCEGSVGSFEQDKFADVVVLDYKKLPYDAGNRYSELDDINDLQDVLFKMMILGDERVVDSVYVAGVSA